MNNNNEDKLDNFEETVINQNNKQESKNEEVEDGKNDKEFDKKEIGRVGRGIHNSENMEDLMNILKSAGDLLLANGKRLDGNEQAEVIRGVTKDIMSGKFDIDRGSLFITRTFGLRDHFERLINKEVSENKKIEEDIKKASNFAELYSVLEKSKNIYSSDNRISPNEWIGTIELLRKNLKEMNIDINEHPQVLNCLTRNMGLRDKVKDLLEE